MERLSRAQVAPAGPGRYPYEGQGAARNSYPRWEKGHECRRHGLIQLPPDATPGCPQVEDLQLHPVNNSTARAQFEPKGAGGNRSGDWHEH